MPQILGLANELCMKSNFRVIKGALGLCRPRQRSGGSSPAGPGEGKAGRAEQNHREPNHVPGGAPRGR